MASSTPPPAQARRPDYQRITSDLRQQIISGSFPAGSRLPSTEQLAVTCASSVYTVHTALAALAKEGWIERIHGAGTFVAEPKNRFTCAGIYHESDISSSRRSDYVRNVHECLLEQFHRLKKETQVFFDSRPFDKRDTVLPALLEAIKNRHIQCLVAPMATFMESPALAQLTLPIAFAGNPGSQNRVDFDKEDFVREGVRALARQGCRTVGFINPAFASGLEPETNPFHGCFHDSLRDEGLTTQPEWISQSFARNDSAEGRGYLEFKRLWGLRKKPDGLLVFPDTYARGVVMAVLKTGLAAVSSRMKFVFHRNAHGEMLCPFPVTWAISNEDALAKGLIQIIEKQFRGEKVTPTLIPYEFKEDKALKWQ